MSIRVRTVRRSSYFFSATLMVSTVMSVNAPGAVAEPVHCSGAVTAASYHHVVVPEGATCVLQSSVVSGNVQVEPGGTFVTEASDIGGSVIGHDVNRVVIGRSTVGQNVIIIGGQPAAPPPVAVSLCGTDVGRNVIIHQVTGGIGLRTYLPGFDPPNGVASRCGGIPNEIQGNLVVSNNSSFRALVHNNVVQGNMLVVRNTGPGEKTFTGNTVEGNLVCVENDEPFTQTGNVAGSGIGQCGLT